MRKSKAFFSVAIPAAVMLVAGTAVMGGPKGARPRLAAAQQQQQPLTTCGLPDETTFTVTRGPSFVPCPDASTEECTQIEYQVRPVPEGFVYVLEGTGVVDVSPNVVEITEVGLPCEGVDSFGAGACHQQAIRTVPDDSGKFSITLAGTRNPSPTSVALRPEGFTACEILGVGLEDSRNPDQPTQTTETVDFKGCAVEFVKDAATGEVLSAELTEDSPANCKALFPGAGRTLVPQPVNDLEVRLADGTSLGKGKFGDGYLSTGGDSCTTRVIGGKVYTWGTPCP